MSQAKHTPGPWEPKPPRIGAAITIYAGDKPIATTCSNTAAVTMEMHRSGEVKANARLIAVAPELLDIAETIALGLKRGYTPAELLDENSPIMDRIRAAIAKATGSAA